MKWSQIGKNSKLILWKVIGVEDVTSFYIQILVTHIKASFTRT